MESPQSQQQIHDNQCAEGRRISFSETCTSSLVPPELQS